MLGPKALAFQETTESSKRQMVRHEHSAYVFQNAIWIAGGHAQPLSSDVWKLELPPDWTGE